MRLTFHRRLWKLIFNRISWNASQNRMGLVSSWSRIKIFSYEVKLIFSIFWSNFHRSCMSLAFQPILTSLWVHVFNEESHEDWESSSFLIKIHIQVSIEFSSLVIFKLSFVTLHLPLALTVGGSSNIDQMSYTHPNYILSVAMSSMRQEEEMRKNPFWNFWVDWLWPFNFQAKISKFKYLGFYSSGWKTEDSSRKLEIKRRHGGKLIFRFWVFHLHKSLWLFNFP